MISENLRECLITTPEECLGDVMGELNRIGAWLDNWLGQSGPKNENGIVFFSARMPVEVLDEFKRWLPMVCWGKATIEECT